VWCLHGRGFYLDALQGHGTAARSLSPRKYDPLIFLKLWLGLRRERYDILHLHLSFSTLFGGIAGRLAHVPNVIVTIHGLKNQSLPWIFPLWKALAPLYRRFVAEVELSVEELLETGIPPHKVAFIRLGTTKVDVVPSEAPPTVDHRGVNGTDPIILNIARLHPHKGQIYLVRAMRDVVGEIPSAKLLVVGDGPIRSVLEREIQELQLERSVYLLGFRRDLEALYSSCDIFVLPSVREGMGLATIQAMAYGKPVIACDVGAVSEAVRPHRTGMLVAPEDPDALARAIISLLRDAEARERLGRAARSFAQSRFSLDRMVSEYDALYSELASERTQGRGYTR
jgi:glycosyltransferase involved in cell wall biosynthesis